jgi:hypothetical protein
MMVHTRSVLTVVSFCCFRNRKNDGEKITSLNWQASAHESKEDALAWQNSRAGLVAPVYVFELPFSVLVAPVYVFELPFSVLEKGSSNINWSKKN